VDAAWPILKDYGLAGVVVAGLFFLYRSCLTDAAVTQKARIDDLKRVFDLVESNNRVIGEWVVALRERNQAMETQAEALKAISQAIQTIQSNRAVDQTAWEARWRELTQELGRMTVRKAD
jgi:hypothetical protein